MTFPISTKFKTAKTWHRGLKLGIMKSILTGRNAMLKSYPREPMKYPSFKMAQNERERESPIGLHESCLKAGRWTQ